VSTKYTRPVNRQQARFKSIDTREISAARYSRGRAARSEVSVTIVVQE
jgi:hypothetical protein